MSTIPPPLPPRPVPAPLPGRGWWQRNWKWALALGVPGVILGLVCVAVYAVRALLQNSDVHADAVARARVHPQVTAALGEPVDPGFMPMGHVSISTGGGGDADLRIPLRGSRSEGRLLVVAERRGGRWHYDTLMFEAAAQGEGRPLVEAGTPVRPRLPPRQ